MLKTVERRYARLFEQEAKLSTETGNLVFTGQGDDPDTLETLTQPGLRASADISHVIRTWHYGRYRATQSVEARERLTELTPELLRVFGESKRADEALLRFDQFHLRPAGRHPALLAARQQSDAALADRQHHVVGTAACRDHRHQAACLRRHARPAA